MLHLVFMKCSRLSCVSASGLYFLYAEADVMFVAATSFDIPESLYWMKTSEAIKKIWNKVDFAVCDSVLYKNVCDWYGSCVYLRNINSCIVHGWYCTRLISSIFTCYKKSDSLQLFLQNTHQHAHNPFHDVSGQDA